MLNIFVVASATEIAVETVVTLDVVSLLSDMGDVSVEISVSETSETAFISDMTFADESSVSDMTGISVADASGRIVCVGASSEDIPITY